MLTLKPRDINQPDKATQLLRGDNRIWNQSLLHPLIYREVDLEWGVASRITCFDSSLFSPISLMSPQWRSHWWTKIILSAGLLNHISRHTASLKIGFNLKCWSTFDIHLVWRGHPQLVWIREILFSLNLPLWQEHKESKCVTGNCWA